MTTRKYYPEVDAKGRIIPEVAVADAPRLRQIARVLETSRAIRDAVAAGDLDPVALDLLSEVGLLPGAGGRNAGFESSPLGYLRGGTSRLSEELGIRSGNLGPSEIAGNRNYGPGRWDQYGTEPANGQSGPSWSSLPSRRDLVSYTPGPPPETNTPNPQTPITAVRAAPQGVPSSPYTTQIAPFKELPVAPGPPHNDASQHPPFGNAPPGGAPQSERTAQPAASVFPKLDDIGQRYVGQPRVGPKFDVGPDGSSPGAAAFARWLSGRFHSPATSWNPLPASNPDRSRPIDGENGGAIRAPQFRLHRGALVGVERQPSDAEMIRRPRSNEPDDLRGITPR